MRTPLQPDTRPLTDPERELLRSYSDIKPFREIGDVLLGTAFLTSILFIFPSWLWHWIGPKVGCNDMNVAFTVIFVIALGIVIQNFTWPEAKRRSRLSKSPFVKDCRDELAEGVAKVEELDVTAADELPEYEDEGVGFFLQLADGRVLFVQGQDLYDHAHDYWESLEESGPPKPPEFPSSRLRYSYGPKTGFRFGMECLGKFVKPGILHKLAFVRGKPRSDFPEDGKFYEGTLDDVRKKFGLTIAGK